MTSVSSQSSIKYRIRSNSLPSRTHVAKQRVEDELNKLKSWEEASASSSISAGETCYGLSGLQELYRCIDEFLNLPSTMEALICKEREKWVDELLDKSVKLLDKCGIAKDMVSNCKENVRDLQSSLRRRTGNDSKIVPSITNYFSCSRKMKKEAKKSLASLKQLHQEINASALAMVDLDGHVSSVITILQQVNSTSILIFQAVLRFLSSESYKQKTNKWTVVKRLVQKEDHQQIQNLNEMENAEACLRSVCESDTIEKDPVHIVQNNLSVFDDVSPKSTCNCSTRCDVGRIPSPNVKVDVDSKLLRKVLSPDS